MAKIVSCNISEQKGLIKHAVDSVVLIEDFGIEGDAHAEKGSKRQISLLARETEAKNRPRQQNSSLSLEQREAVSMLQVVMKGMRCT